MKKIKTEDVVDGDDKNDKEYREQVKLLFKNRDKLAQMKPNELQDLLMENGQQIPTGKDNVSTKVEKQLMI